MFYQIFLSLHVKRCANDTYIHDIQLTSLVGERVKTWNLKKFGNIKESV